MSYDTTQMDKLENYLKDNGYNYARDRRWPPEMEKALAMTNPGEDGGEQIVVYKDGTEHTEENRLWDVICGYGSYGYKDGLLVVMEEKALKGGELIHPGVIVPEEVRDGDNDAIWGDLSANDIIRRLIKQARRTAACRVEGEGKRVEGNLTDSQTENDAQLDHLNNNDVVFVVGLDKNTGFVKASTSCDRKDAPKYAQHYRNIGYGTRTVDREGLDALLGIQKLEIQKECEAEARTESEDDLEL